MTNKKNRKNNKNRHGLSRSIPPRVKLEVRQRCGFGCVVCGSGLIQYDHVSPEYVDAKSHEPENIALLCPTCHDNKTRKYWSIQKILNAMQNPACKKIGFTKNVFDFCGGHPKLKFGGITFEKSVYPIKIDDEYLLKIDEPEFEGGPFRLSGFFYDSKGNRTLEIIENEWKAFTDTWDVIVSAGSISILDGPKNIVLKLSVEPPESITVEILDMKVGVINFKIFNGETRIFFPGFDNKFMGSSTGGMQFKLK